MHACFVSLTLVSSSCISVAVMPFFPPCNCTAAVVVQSLDTNQGMDFCPYISLCSVPHCMNQAEKSNEVFLPANLTGHVNKHTRKAIRKIWLNSARSTSAVAYHLPRVKINPQVPP